MTLITILLTIAISFIKLGQGLDIDLKHLVTRTNRWLVFRGVLAAVFLVPLLFLILILIFQPIPSITLAIICMAVAPAADLSSRQVETLGGDKRLAESILLIAALISLVTTPLLLKVFELILGLNLEIEFTQVIKQVAIAQFIPIIISLLLLKFFPAIEKFGKYIINIATVILVISFMLIIIQNHAVFGEFKVNAYLAVVIVTVSAFVLGVLFAGKNIKRQITLAVESSMRNPGLAFLIASENFLKERVDLAMVPYLVTTFVTIIACTLFLKTFHTSLR